MWLARSPDGTRACAIRASLSAVEVMGAPVGRGELILTAEALTFLGELQRRFGARRDELLVTRRKRRAEAAATPA